jgi:hypothetical protein
MATQFIPKEVMDTIPKQIPVKYEAGRGNTQRPAGFDPESIGAQADIQGRSLVGYYKQVNVPGLPEVDAKGFPLPRFLARYDTNGVLQNISASEPYWATTGQGENDIHVTPKFNAQGELVETGENTNKAAGGSDFISQLGRIAKETAPIWMSALGANLFTGANLLGGGAGAAAAPAASTGTGLLSGSTGAGLTAGSTGTGLTAGGSGLGLSTGGAGLGLTAASPGAAAIGGSLGTTLAGINTGIGAAGAASALSGAGSAAGSMAPVDYGLTSGGAATSSGGIMDSLAKYGSGVVDFAKQNPQLAGSLLGALGGAIDAANAPKEQTTTTSIDPDVKREYMANLERAKSAAAGLGVRQFAQPGQMYTDAEKQLYNLGMTPFGAADIQQFFNPYEEQVVQGALGDIERSRLMQDIADRERAIQSKAFGGSRQAVQSALTNEEALRIAATTASGLRQKGFTEAADLGFRARPINVTGLQTSMGLGAQRDALRQAELDAARNIELERLGITGGALGLQPARTGETSTQPLYTSTAGSALSGGLTGAYIGSLLQPKKA